VSCYQTSKEGKQFYKYIETEIYFKLKMGFYLVAVSVQYNTQMHNTHIKRREKNGSQSYTNCEGHITATEYSIEREREREKK
jgi:hypothetical protein